MAKLAFLDLIFMFDPNEVWAHKSEFDRAMSRFLDQLGLEAEVIETIDLASKKQVYYIKKKTGLGALEDRTTNRPDQPKSLKSQFDKYRNEKKDKK